MKRRVGIVFGVVVAAAALAFVLYRWRTSGFSWRAFADSLRNVDWNWLALALVLILATYVGRALRWEVMLRPLAKHASLLRVLSATCIGFTAVVLFGRAGEPVRPYLIARQEGVSFSSQVAAWVVERILDVLMILVIFGIALTQVSHSSIRPSPRIEVTLQAGGAVAGVTGFACLALLVGLRQFKGKVQKRLLEALSFLPAPTLARIQAFFAAFEEGMQSTRSSAFAFLLVGYTIIEWIVIAACFYCVFRAFPATDRPGFHRYRHRARICQLRQCRADSGRGRRDANRYDPGTYAVLRSGARSRLRRGADALGDQFCRDCAGGPGIGLP